MNRCFNCKKESTEIILDLGESPIANNLETDLDESKNAKKFPLSLRKCKTSCNHIQIGNIIDQKEIFSDYFYMPSFSKTLTKHLQEISSDLNKRFGIEKESLIIDIGSNDGTFLESTRQYTNKILGIDPAKNLATIANNKGINTLNSFFTNDLAKEIREKYGKAKFIVSTNTFAHTPEINDFVQGVKNLISNEGVIIIEIHYLGSMVNDNSFDTIYHEHFSYWSLENLNNLFKRYDLNIFDASIIPVHHGQLRIYISKNKNLKKTKSFKKILEIEKDEDLIGNKLNSFCKNVNKIKKELVDLLEKISNEGKKVNGYGAPAKASTLINFIGENNLEYIYDRSELKQGKFIPGTSIQIKNPDEIKKDKPDYIFLFAWNFTNEIIDDLKLNYNFKGKIIIPIPNLKIITI
ncbi:MAG: hypothetical protein CL769_01755 [Chloroflexi bacterium]|nr:hypothetical protein [Chloroflexota bacterium]|tara:strand:+ start:1286 stop:2506 length:1221 start_codon:yes stop_codon:yes gene_type:complete